MPEGGDGRPVAGGDRADADGIVCEGLAKTFGAGPEAVQAVCPLDLRIAGGTTTAFVGPSGCGKSTLLRLIAGLEEPSAGTVAIAGESPADLRGRAGLAMAFQDPSLLPWRTVRGNILLALRLAGTRADPAAVDAMIDRVGLAGFADRRPAELSGGMRQRAAIARCLITEPGLLLLDEPFGAVDALTRRRLNHDLAGLWEGRGTTTLLVTHSIREAVLLSDRVLVFSPRPARVVADIAVDLERPRAEGSAGFRTLVDEVMGQLYDAEEAAHAARAAE